MWVSVSKLHALQPPTEERGIRMFSEMQNISSQYIDPNNVAISRYLDMRFQESTHQLPKLLIGFHSN